jgi:hypothetical protein
MGVPVPVDVPQDPVVEQAPPQPEEVTDEAVTTAGPSFPVALELGGLTGYASAPIRGGTNPFGAGFGGRGTLQLGHVDIGVAIVDYLGGTDVDVRYRALLYGLELGYTIRLASLGKAVLELRPRAGIGEAAVYYTDPSLAVDVVSSASGGGGRSSDTLTVSNVYVQPALVLQLDFPGAFVGLEGSTLVLPGIAYGGADPTTWVSYSTGLQAGLRF